MGAAAQAVWTEPALGAAGCVDGDTGGLVAIQNGLTEAAAKRLRRVERKGGCCPPAACSDQSGIGRAVCARTCRPLLGGERTSTTED